MTSLPQPNSGSTTLDESWGAGERVSPITMLPAGEKSKDSRTARELAKRQGAEGKGAKRVEIQ